MENRPRKPTKEEVEAAVDRTVPDLIAPDLTILFSGINPSLYSAAVGQHFARPGNRFWPTLFAAGLTPRLLLPSEGTELLGLGYGITNIVARATRLADELSRDELQAGMAILERKAAKFRPKTLAFLGITAYRAAFGRNEAKIGLQPERIADSTVWVLPNPSGLNAHYQLRDLASLFKDLKQASDS